MARVAASQSNNPIEGSQARQDKRTFAKVTDGSLMEHPPKNAVPIFSYTWRYYDPPAMPHDYDKYLEDWKWDMMCVTHGSMTGYECVQLDTCYKFDGSHARPQHDKNILEYSWYKRAAVCLVYLENVKHTKDKGEMLNQLENDLWFREPWALQELLASPQIYFYSQEGTRFRETKSDLLEWLAGRTGIDKSILEDPDEIENACIAKRMSWAVSRSHATLDVVHSLKGIFDVSMTRIPRERITDAFHRLQMKLIQKYPHDISIFAWKFQPGFSHGRDRLLADLPKDFASCAMVTPLPGESPMRVTDIRDEYATVNLPIVKLPCDNYLLCLHCYEPKPTTTRPNNPEPPFDSLTRAMAIHIKFVKETGYYGRFDVTQTEIWTAGHEMRSFTVESSGLVRDAEEVEV